MSCSCSCCPVALVKPLMNNMKSILATVFVILCILTCSVLISWVVVAVQTGQNEEVGLGVTVGRQTGGFSWEDVVEELRLSNQALESRLQMMETKLNMAEEKVREVNSDFHFYNVRRPTVEHNFPKLTIHNWNTSLRNGLLDASVSFEAGKTLGSQFHSSWSLYLTSTAKSSTRNGSLNIHLALDKWTDGQKSIYAGFTVNILGPQGQVIVKKTHKVTNVLSAIKQKDSDQWYEIEIQNFLDLHTIPQLLNNGSLKLRAKVELIGYGHKLYDSKLGVEEPLAQDMQTVEFAVLDLKQKLKQLQKDGNPESSENNYINSTNVNLAFSRFILNHPWHAKSKWNAQLVKLTDKEDNLSLLFSLTEVYDDIVLWEQFFASVRIHVDVSKDEESSSKSTVTSTPLQDFMKEPHLLLENIVPSKIIQTLDSNDILEFRISMTVYNTNSRFYVDV